MLKLAVPEEALEKLRCSLCKEYLSQLPVYIYPGQEGTACGRCPVLTDQNPTRDTTYEILAAYLYFPCRYKPYGCLANVLSINMESHEESCMYKQYFCPFIPLASCPWQGPSNELFSHYEDHHKILALQTPIFEVDLVNMYEDNYMLKYNNETFVIHAKCDSKENTFWCSIRYIGNKKAASQYLYQVELKKHNSIECVKLSKKVVESDNSVCLDKSSAVHVKSEDIRQALGDPCSLLCAITITPNEQSFSDPTDLSDIKPSTSIETKDVDRNILTELECPVCNEYMVPPIHQCITGHSICAVCKVKVPQCPTCREQILDTRNFTLEKMTTLIKYTCKYSDFGCQFISLASEIKEHETTCQHGPFTCPLDKFCECKWKGKLSDVLTHCKDQHEDNVLDVCYITWPCQSELCDETDDDCYIIQAHNALFKLIFKYEGRFFQWAMQFVGPVEETKNYMFDLDICDNTTLNQRLYIKRCCSNSIEVNDPFTENSTCIKLPLELLTPLLNGQDLVYQCRILEI